MPEPSAGARLDPRERRVLLAALAAGAAGIAAMALAPVLGLAEDGSELVLDPSAYWGFNRRSGTFSFLGLGLWFAAAGAAAFAASRLARATARRRFLAVLAAASAGLGLDDALSVHEGLGELAGFGLADEIVQVLYAAALVAFLARARDVLAGTPAVALAGAGACFAVSLALDAAPADPHVVEDGLKLAGILLWAAYLWLTATRFADAATAPPRR